MKAPDKPEILNRFIKHYLNKFDTPDPSELLLSMVARGIIDPERLRNYMIIEDYYKNLRKYKGQTKFSVLDTAEAYQLCERQIQNIVYKWANTYRSERNIDPEKRDFFADLN